MAIVRSIQRGSIALAAAAPSDTFTLSTPVVPENCWVVLNGAVSAANTVGVYSAACAIVTLTGPSTVTAARGATGFTLTVHFTIIEFDPSVINSIQRGQIDVHEGATTGAAALSPAPTANAFLDTTGSSMTAQLGLGNLYYALSLSGSTITATMPTAVPAGDTYSIGYCLVDLTSEVIASAQQLTVPIAAGLVFNAPVNASLIPEHSIIIINGLSHQGGSFAGTGSTNAFFRSAFTDVLDDAVTPMRRREAAPQATFTRNASLGAAGTLMAYAVEFVAGALTDHIVQAGTLPAGTASTATLPNPLGDLGMCFPGGFQSQQGVNANGGSVAIYLVNPSTIQAQTFFAGTATAAYYAVDFGEGGVPPEPEPERARHGAMVVMA